MIEKVVFRGEMVKKLTLSRIKKHTLWQHKKYMVHMEFQEIYRPSMKSYKKCYMMLFNESLVVALNYIQNKVMSSDQLAYK